MRDVLRALIAHARDLILVEDELHALGPAGLRGVEFGNVNDGAVDDAAAEHEILAARPLQLFLAGARAGRHVPGHAAQAGDAGSNGRKNLVVA